MFFSSVVQAFSALAVTVEAAALSTRYRLAPV